MSKDNVILTFIPTLVATLLNREKSKGSPLTENEVIEIRDNAPVIALRPDEAAKLNADRGYHDIDPDNCWEAWQKARMDLINAK